MQNQKNNARNNMDQLYNWLTVWDKHVNTDKRTIETTNQNQPRKKVVLPKKTEENKTI
tara:strand:- start:2252 stop:2425 length:174 start_codon:yes stop_codon:yes gene_type:complete